MNIQRLAIFLFILGLFACKQEQNSSKSELYSSVKVSGAMKNVMWKGELAGIIDLGTLANKQGVYGLGPEEFLTGELLINDSKIYVSRVLTDSTMTVEEVKNVKAPFFVSAQVNTWQEIHLPSEIINSQDLEKYLDQQTQDQERPFAFKLKGKIKSAMIHIQNLPEGTKVSSPAEAHQGQTNYSLEEEEVEIIGFFSTEHKGIFTHHDSFIHLHLITKDGTKMGHLDQVEFDTESMTLFLPKK